MIFVNIKHIQHTTDLSTQDNSQSNFELVTFIINTFLKVLFFLSGYYKIFVKLKFYII